jgi:hypothetical protein
VSDLVYARASVRACVRARVRVRVCSCSCAGARAGQCEYNAKYLLSVARKASHVIRVQAGCRDQDFKRVT